MLAIKSVKQSYRPSAEIQRVMQSFQRMTNDCIQIGIKFEGENAGSTPSRRRLSLLSYGELKRYPGYSKYRVSAISKAAGILSARRKSTRRGVSTKAPYLSKALLFSSYGFSIKDGNLVVHLEADGFESIPLASHTLLVLASDPELRIRSFILTEKSVSLCVSKEVREIGSGELTGALGVDRNLRNLTVGDGQKVTHYDLTKAVDIAETTRSIVRSFKRSDVRIRRRIFSKYGRRRRERTVQLLNLVSKKIVQDAKVSRQAIVFEKTTGIRRLYRRGNGQGTSFRGRMNSWPFYEMKRQVEYKAAWEGVPVITLTKSETKGTTMDCPRCGERLQVPIRGDQEHHRQLWCEGCGRWADRDVIAVMNISRRGRLRFDRSEGGASEAMRGNPGHEGDPVILRVDASKLCIR